MKNQKGRVSLAIAAIPAKKYLVRAPTPGSGQDLRVPQAPLGRDPSFAKACGNYTNSYLAGIDAAEDGYEEAILLDQNGFVAEGTGENIFVVRDGIVYTPGRNPTS